MSTETERQPSGIDQLGTLLKQILASEEPTESQLAELGESVFAALKAALSGTT